MHGGYYHFAGWGIWELLLCLFIAIFIVLAPFMIWRNTNTANRLLSLICIQIGVPIEEVERALHGKCILGYSKSDSKE